MSASNREIGGSGKDGCKGLPSSDTGTPTSSVTDDNVSAEAVSTEASPRLTDHTVEDPDKCSNQQAEIASIILQLSQQPAKKRRTRSSCDADMPKYSPSPPAAMPTLRPDSMEKDQHSPAPQIQSSQATAGGIHEQRVEISQLQPSPPLHPQLPRQHALAPESSISPSSIQPLKLAGFPKAAETRKPYRCSKCGAEKKGHVCSAKTTSEALPSSSQVEVKRGDLAARLAARLQGGTKEGPETTLAMQSSGARRASDDLRHGILLAATKHELARIPFVRSFSAEEVFDHAVLNHPALASGLPILLKCPPEGWAKVVQLPAALPAPAP